MDDIVVAILGVLSLVVGFATLYISIEGDERGAGCLSVVLFCLTVLCVYATYHAATHISAAPAEVRK